MKLHFTDYDLISFTGTMWDEPLTTVAAELLRARQRIRELEEQQRWIPVSERLPEAGKRVQVRIKNNFIVIATLFHNGTWKSDNACDVTKNVTHWRPLPEPPEEK